MKLYLILIALTLFSCRHNPEQEKEDVVVAKKGIVMAKPTEAEHRDSIHQCESEHFTSLLEEIPNTDTNAYRLTIASKDGKTKFTKVLDVRPKMSRISYCNDLYTVVGFACGGPCYSRVFVFTDNDRPFEQYAYPQEVKNSITLIGHIENEEFEKLIIHNFENSKEIVIPLPDINLWNYGQVDSMVVDKDHMMLHYQSKNKKSVTRRVNLKGIF